MPRFTVLVRVLLLILALLGPIAAAYGQGEDTPRVNGPFFNALNPYYTNGLRGQCTWYTWGRAGEIGWNVNYTGGPPGYLTTASGSGTGVSPRVYAIMVSHSFNNKGDRIDHLSFVESVTSETEWTIAQYNVLPLQFSRGTVTRATASSKTLSGAGFRTFYLDGFLYPPASITPSNEVNNSPYGTPKIGYSQNGSMILGMRGQNGHTYVLQQLSPNGEWGSWSDLGGFVYGNPIFGRAADGLARLFNYGTDGQIYSRFQAAANGTSWSDWTCLGGNTNGDPAVASNFDGRIQIVVRNAAGGNLNTIYMQSTGNWSSWINWGGSVRSLLSMAQNADGRLELFILGTDNAIYDKWQTGVNGDWYGSFGYLGGNVPGRPVSILDGAGRLRVFVLGGDGYIYYKYQTAPGSGYSNWSFVAGGSSAVSNPAVAVYNGQVYVFVRGSDNSIYYSCETSLNSWTSWRNLNCNVSGDPAVAYNQDGRLQLFCRGHDGTIYSIWMVYEGGWSLWKQMGDSVSRF